MILASILFGCSEIGEDAEIARVVDPTENVEVVDSALEARVAALLGIGYPKLDNENCEELLMNWGVENGLHNVILKTKHGEIEIELFDDTLYTVIISFIKFTDSITQTLSLPGLFQNL